MLAFWGCLKQYTIYGTLKDRKGRAIQNAIIDVTSAVPPKRFEFWKKNVNISVRSDKRGKFTIEDGFQKNEDYNIAIRPLAHEDLLEPLVLENDSILKLRYTLLPRNLALPYRNVNLNIENVQLETDPPIPTEETSPSSKEDTESTSPSDEESTNEESTKEVEEEETEESDDSSQEEEEE
jgi:hypothetical protein